MADNDHSGDDERYGNNAAVHSDDDKRSKKRKTPSASRSRSRSRSRERRRTKRSPSKSRSRSGSPEGVRVHIGEIDSSVTERDIESAFGKFGKLTECWVATFAPYFAFVRYKTRDDAEEAVRYMSGTYLRNCKIRVSVALPRRRPRSMGSGYRPPRYGGYDNYGGGGGYGRRDYYGGGGGYGGGGRGYGGGDRDYYDRDRSSRRRRSPSYERRRSRSRD